MTENTAYIEDENKLLPDGAEEYILAAVKQTLALEGISNACAAVSIVTDGEIKELNRRMRQVDSVTDVLSFPEIDYPAGTRLKDRPGLIKRAFDPSLDAYFLGDVALNVKRAAEQAGEYGHSLKREIAYLTCHAMLHLCGYDHMTEGDKAEMRSREKQVMKQLEIFK